MAFAEHTLVAFGGRLTTNTTPEQWQCGVRISGASNLGQAAHEPVPYMNAIAPLMATWFARAQVSTAGSEFAGLRSDAYLDWVKVNNIGSDGKYSNRTTVNRHDFPTTQGSQAPVATPPFVTAAVSLLTAQQRGPGHRGRIYLPFALALSSNGYLSSVQQLETNGTVMALLTLLKYTDASGNLYHPVIASRVDGSVHDITAVATGSVFDVQRRRKEQLPETYITHAWS